MKISPATEAQIRQVAALLDGESTMTLSVCDELGLPHAAPLFYLTGAQTGEEGSHRLDLFWLSSPRSLHSRCLRRDPRATVTVFRPTFVWRQIAGVQMRGQSSRVAASERAALLVRYRERFHLNALLSLAIARSTLYRFHPEWFRLTDNRKGFGWKTERTLE